jgi:signal transduction histidine kinase
VYFLPHAVVPHDMTFWAAGVPFAFLVASAGYYCPRRRAVAALGVAITSMLLVSVTTPEFASPDSVVWNTMLLFLPWLGGRGLREREDRAASLAGALATERAAREVEVRRAADAERSHIARELHDIVAHSVSMLVIQVGAARMQLRTDPDGSERSLLDAEEVGRQTLDDLRRLLGVLRAGDEGDDGDDGLAPRPPQPGLSSLDQLVAPIRDTGLAVEVRRRGDPVQLPAGQELTAFRIVQEALTNTLKHSGASSARVSLDFEPTQLTIEVVDDGRGGASMAADPDAAERAGGHGLVGIEERVSLYGGTLSSGPLAEGGWQVLATLPLADAVVHRGRPELSAP